MKAASFVVLVLLSTGALAAPRERDGVERTIPLENWLPALWTAAEKEAGADSGEVVATALPSAASHFIAVAPCRVVDTRSPDGPYGGPIPTGGVARAFLIPAGPCPGVPIAAAYSVNLTVTGSAAGSSQFLTAYPSGTVRPVAATMTFQGGSTTSNAALVPADATGSIDVYVSASSHVIVDINGYMKEGVVTSVTAGSGLEGGGTGSVSVGVATGGIGAVHLGASSVTTGAIADAAVTGSKIANAQVVRSVEGITDAVDVLGASGVTVTATGSTLIVSGSAPPGTMVLGQLGDTVLIGAGYTELGPVQEMWRATSTAGAPSPRSDHTAVWTGTTMIVWGGYDLAYPDSGGRYDPLTDSWTPTTTIGAPSGRQFYTAVWTGTRMIVWGGTNGVALFNTGGRYDPMADAWTSTTNTSAPSARQLHTAVWTGTLMVVWGGAGTDALSDRGGRYDPRTDSWMMTTTAGAPAGRYNHSAVWTGSAMIVWGGYDVGQLNTGARYDPAADGWTATTTSGAPLGRYFHTAVWTGTKMIVWGGTTGSMALATGGEYDPSANSWAALPTTGAPSERSHHSAVWTGQRMVVWGGAAAGFLQTGGHYDPEAKIWIATAIPYTLSARLGHSAIWTGSDMIVWGGETGGDYHDTGARWRLLSLYQKN